MDANTRHFEAEVAADHNLEGALKIHPEAKVTAATVL